MTGLPARKRVAVVGGGILGCATAFELARAGHDVHLIERDSIGAHASGKNAGYLNPLFGTPVGLIPFALESFRVHAEVRKELAKLGCMESRPQEIQRVHLCREDAERRDLERTAELMNSFSGFSAEWLNSNHLCRIDPRLSRDFECALRTSGASTIDSFALTQSLLAGAVKLGAKVLHAAVEGVSSSNGRLLAVRLDHEVLSCDECVFATGPWVAETESWLGIRLQVKPVKGELLRVRVDDPIDFDFTWRAHSLYKRRPREVWIGGTQEDTGFDCSPTAKAREFLMAGATTIMPGLGAAKVIDHVAALRPVSPSNMPIAGRADGWQNVYIANGGGAKGVLLSVGIARRIRNLVAEG